MKKTGWSHLKHGILYLSLLGCAVCLSGCADLESIELPGFVSSDTVEFRLTTTWQAAKLTLHPYVLFSHATETESTTENQTEQATETTSEEASSESAQPDSTEASSQQTEGGKTNSITSGTGNVAESSDGYILPDSDSRYLTYADLDQLTKEECKLARNEIYARHGRLFQDEELQAYFNSRSWYQGVIEPDDFTDDMLNEYEIANRDLIVAYEQEKGYR